MSKPQTQKTCFVISPIGKDGSVTRKRSDKLLKYVIREVLDKLGYTVDRADQINEPGVITNQIVKKIVDCDLLVADLSESNPNVFYELAIRHGVKKPFVHFIDASEAIPFDNAQVRTISVDLTDLDSVERAKRELELQVKSVESGAQIESPISIAFDLEALKTSGNKDEAVLAALFQELSSLRSDIRDIKRQNKRHQSTNIPDTQEELYNLLNAHGYSELVNILITKASIHEYRPLKIVLSTTLPINEDSDFEKSLIDALLKSTGIFWDVNVLPF